MHRHLFSVAGLGFMLLLAVGSGSSQDVGEIKEGVSSEVTPPSAAAPGTIEEFEAETSSEAAAPSATTLATIPADLEVEVRTMDLIPGVKRSLEVRLGRAIPEDVLRALAFRLRDSDPSKYKRTFMVYFLPGMTPGAGAWATTYFTPELEVTIFGFTAEEELAGADDVLGKVVGTWMLNKGPLAHRLIIYRNGKATFTRMVFKDGSSMDTKVKETRTSKGRRFEDRKGNDFGEFYLLASDGSLESWDRDGLIFTLAAVEK